MSDYKIFTTKYDEIIDAHNLVAPEELNKLSTLAQRNFDQQPNVQAIPSIKTALHSFFGIDDNAKDHSEMAVILLLDNSGSLRGQPISLIHQISTILGNELDKNNIPFEILGYTTTSWKGGQARKDWLASERPRMPGRLNSLRHIIYRHANQNWDDTKNNLNILYKEELLKENIDGEALMWAADRIGGSDAPHQLIIPIGDNACAVDDSTMSVNGSKYLDEHLQYVIDTIDTDSDMHLFPISMQYTEKDNSPYGDRGCKEPEVRRFIKDNRNASTIVTNFINTLENYHNQDQQLKSKHVQNFTP